MSHPTKHRSSDARDACKEEECSVSLDRFASAGQLFQTRSKRAAWSRFAFNINATTVDELVLVGVVVRILVGATVDTLELDGECLRLTLAGVDANELVGLKLTTPPASKRTEANASIADMMRLGMADIQIATMPTRETKTAKPPAKAL